MLRLTMNRSTSHFYNQSYFGWFKTRRKWMRNFLIFAFISTIFGFYLQYLLYWAPYIAQTTIASENLDSFEHNHRLNRESFQPVSKKIDGDLVLDVRLTRDVVSLPEINTSLSILTSSSLTAARTLPAVKTDRFVAWGGWFGDGRGLGNQMFNLAVIVSLAEMSGRRPIIQRVGSGKAIDQVFDLSMIERNDNICSCYYFGEHRSLMFDGRVEELGQRGHPSEDERTIVLHGYYQSWKYARHTTDTVKRFLRFRPEISEFARNFLESVRPSEWKPRKFIRVFIHVRRGDLLTASYIRSGYTVPDRDYFQRAMTYFIERFEKVQFIVMSDDRNWTSANVFYTPTNSEWEKPRVDMAYAFNHTAGQDMAIMAACDHAIMSTGSFGWWGAWFTNGTTIYYKDWPKNGTTLEFMFKREDFFPPLWIPM